MDHNLQFGYSAVCDDASAVSPGHGDEAGHSRILDIDSRCIGEPVFNNCRTLAILIDMACVWSQMEVLPMDRVQLKGNLHIRIPGEKVSIS